MKLGLLWVGRTRDRNIHQAIECYIARIGRYVPVVVREVREEAVSDRHALAEALVKEGVRIREKIPRDHRMVLLDLAGKEMSSEGFAGFLQEQMNHASQGLTFVVGGHLGVDAATKRAAKYTIALSRMTLTHEMARLVAAEQIYRAMTIIRGGRYHH